MTSDLLTISYRDECNGVNLTSIATTLYHNKNYFGLTIVFLFFSTAALPVIYGFFEFLNEREYSTVSKMKGLVYSSLLFQNLVYVCLGTTTHDYLLYYFSLIRSVAFMVLFIYDLGCLASTSSMLWMGSRIAVLLAVIVGTFAIYTMHSRELGDKLITEIELYWIGHLSLFLSTGLLGFLLYIAKYWKKRRDLPFLLYIFSGVTYLLWSAFIFMGSKESKYRVVSFMTLVFGGLLHILYYFLGYYIEPEYRDEDIMNFAVV
eukprot:TRINITY_DN12434_c0_g1_i4.p1 TRINITY_DN12434_c0_g1~~TRINITY_DN12434_c0_g1_i4.p1  ORF type:complete len:261 (-),score=30.73 TRINITY_DN12434_c0_g1_i4:28-810(-)